MSVSRARRAPKCRWPSCRPAPRARPPAASIRLRSAPPSLRERAVVRASSPQGVVRVDFVRFTAMLTSWGLGIATCLADDVADRVGHQVPGIATRRDDVAQIRGCNLELRHRVDEYPSGECLVQIVDASRASIDHELAERATRRSSPAGTVRDHHVRELQDLAPLMPLRQAEKRIHAHDQAERTVGMFAPQLGQGEHRVRCPRAAPRGRRRRIRPDRRSPRAPSRAADVHRQVANPGAGGLPPG